MKKTIFRPSPTSIDVWRRRDSARIRLLEGAVRSGKSYTANDLALREIQELPPCNVLISGYSITSVARNVLAEWRSEIDPYNRGLIRVVKTDKDEHVEIDWRGLRGKKFYLRGAGKENDYMQIQGATFGYWLADELTRHAENFVDMSISRLSLEYSRATWTTNPDHPLHYVKRRFIDDETLYRVDQETCRSELARWTFYLKDNPSLSPVVLRRLSSIYHGVFRQRFIESKWVMAEGAIYDFFTDGVHTRDRFPTAECYYVGIDYGTHNPTVFIEYGRNDLTTPRIWAAREYYYDSVKEGRQKDDAEQAVDFCDFTSGKDYRAVIHDPSAASLVLAIKRELARRGRHLRFVPADNEVLAGIRTQMRMLKSGEYVVGKKCTCTIGEYGAYIWDKRAALRGEDAPVKANDHGKDNERYTLQTLFGGEHINYAEKLR